MSGRSAAAASEQRQLFSLNLLALFLPPHPHPPPPPKKKQGLTTALFPLTVVKTRQMALPEAPRGVRGALSVGRDVVRADGVRGLYRGLGTVMVGIIPARGVYLTTLEAVKAATERALEREEAARVKREEKEEEEEAASRSSRREGSAGATSSSSGSSSAAWSPSSLLPRLSEPQKAGAANAVGGAVASLVTQFFTVPVDVVSQRLMIMESSGKQGSAGGTSSAPSPPASAAAAARPARPPPPPARSGLAMARSIVRAEGVLGLYRGFGASVATFVPSSAVWWSAYGFWQRLIWQNLDRRGEATATAASPASPTSTSSSPPPLSHSSGEILAVQTASALAAGCTSAVLTTPLDVVKTRLQVSGSSGSGGGGGSGSGATAPTKAPSAASVVRQLLREDGFRGLFRGLGPRTASVALWGTCMVNAYEALKRAAATKPPSE